MPSLRLNQTGQKVFHLRRQRERWWWRFRCQLQRHAQFLRQVRHGQTAFALTRKGKKESLRLGARFRPYYYGLDIGRRAVFSRPQSSLALISVKSATAQSG